MHCDAKKKKHQEVPRIFENRSTPHSIAESRLLCAVKFQGSCVKTTRVEQGAAGVNLIGRSYLHSNLGCIRLLQFPAQQLSAQRVSGSRHDAPSGRLSTPETLSLVISTHAYTPVLTDSVLARPSRKDRSNSSSSRSSKQQSDGH